jgi:hypothetical protein
MARTGMATLISNLRDLGVAGTADYTLGTTTYWTDAQVQTVLDKHKVFVNSEQLQPIETLNNGTVLYTEYRSQFGNFEETTGGTTIFVIKNSIGSVFGTSNWSADYANGIINFTANTAGTPYYLTGTSYDVYGAAADVWRMKSGHHAQSIDFSTDNMSVKRGQLMKNDMEMANYYAGMGRVRHMAFDRDDTPGCYRKDE